jgi:hypothetical protein
MSKKNGEKSGEPRARVVENGGERPSTPTREFLQELQIERVDERMATAWVLENLGLFEDV